MESTSPLQCEKCGAPLAPGKLQCPRCGAPAPNVVFFPIKTGASTPARPAAKRGARFWIGLVGLAGGGLCSCLASAGLAFHLLGGANLLGGESASLQQAPPTEGAGVTPDTPPPAAPNAPVGAPEQPATRSFFDDFSNPNGGWKQVVNENYRMGYTPEGTYQMLLNVPDETVVSYPPLAFAEPISDILVSFKASGQAGDGSFGMLCHLQDNQNFYRVSFMEGYYAVDQYENGEYIELTQPIWKPLIAYQPAADGMMEVEVACSDGRIQVVVNEVGQEIITISDQASGSIGLFAASRQQAGGDGVYMQAFFDDFSAELP